MTQIKYYSVFAENIIFEIEGKQKSIGEFRDDLFQESDIIIAEYDHTFFRIVYKREVKREGWTPKTETLHIELIPLKLIDKIDVIVERDL